LPGGARAVLFAEATGDDLSRAAEAVTEQGAPVPPPALGGSGGPAAVDVRNPAVSQRDEVVDGFVRSELVGRADNVDRGGMYPAGDGDDGEPRREVGEQAGGGGGSEQDQRVTAVVEQAVNGPPRCVLR
jgi:hypothetical protein